jgi:hypothetical protein
MSRPGLLLVGLLFGLSCLHTRETERETEPKKEPEAAAPKAQARKSEVKRPAYPGRPQLAEKPEGLMKPEGPMRIQKKLADFGAYHGEQTGELDEATVEALKRFQGEHGLPKTGAPDLETVRQLGLRPEDIWKKDFGGTSPDRKPAPSE